METLFDLEIEPNMFYIGNSYAVVVLKPEKVVLYRSGVIIKQEEFRSQFDKRVFVVDLIEKYNVTKSKLASALKISRVSIDTWISAYRRGGLIELVNSTKIGVGRKSENPSPTRPQGNKEEIANQERVERKEEEKIKQETIEKQQIKIDFDKEEMNKEAENKDSEFFNQQFEYQKNRYAGAFIYWAIIQKDYKIMSAIEKLFGCSSIVFFLFIFMQVKGFCSIEQLKTIYKFEFGKLLGLNKLESLPGLWKKVHSAINLRRSVEVKTHFFKMQIARGIVSVWYLFIDGHFLPYTGKEKVHKNYHTQTDKMEPGQNEIFIHDINGNIVYFDIQEGKGDMLSVIRQQSKEFSPFNNNIPPLFIVDKEIWGVEKFLSIPKARFITGEKNTNSKDIYSIADKLFSIPFKLNGKIYQCYEREKEYKDSKSGSSILLRQIIIWNHSTDKRRVAVAQDSYEDTETLAKAFLNRWGKSEDSFKHMGNRIKMHYNPVYNLNEPSENQETYNPEYFEADNKLKASKKRLNRIEVELGRRKLTTNKDGSLRKSKVRDNLHKDKEQLKVQIQKEKEILSECPEKIKIDANSSKKSYKLIDTEGKNIWDMCETIFWNSRKILIKYIAEYIPNERDTIPVLEAITNCMGYVKSTEVSIVVILEPLETPRFRHAQEQLCRKLNELEARYSNGKLILFDVAENVQV